MSDMEITPETVAETPVTEIPAEVTPAKYNTQGVFVFEADAEITHADDSTDGSEKSSDEEDSKSNDDSMEDSDEAVSETNESVEVVTPPVVETPVVEVPAVTEVPAE